MNNNLFTELVPSEEASASGGNRPRRPRNVAIADGSANALGAYTFTNAFTDTLTVDGVSSTSVASSTSASSDQGFDEIPLFS